MGQQDPVQATPVVQPPPVYPTIKIEKPSEFLFSSRPPGPLSVLEFSNPGTGVFNYIPYDVTRPTLLRFQSIATVATADDFSPAYWPTTNPEDQFFGIDPSLPNQFALQPKGPDIWLWSAGRWWITMDLTTTAPALRAQYTAIALEDPTLVDHFLNVNNRPWIATCVADLATGAAAVVLTLAQMLRNHRVEFQNTGAVAIRLGFGSTTPTATTGILLAPGASLALEPWAMPMSRVRAFSAAASTLSVRQYPRLIT